ncbi:MAG: DMT family transporter [Nitriliruptorales bacterium]
MAQRQVTPGHGGPPGPSTLAAFLGTVVIGGSNFTAVAFSNKELAPLFGATVRFGAAAVLMFAITFAGRYRLPRGRAITGAVVYGSLGFGAAYGLLYFAIDGLGAGTLSVLLASAPLVTLALAVVYGQERFTTRGVVGAVLVIVGFAVLSADKLGTVRPIYLVAGLLAVLSVSTSTVVIKGYPQAHPVTSNAIGMASGAVLLAAGSLVVGEPWTVPADGSTWMALLWLAVLGTVGMFAMFLYVVKTWTASASAYVVTLMPIVAIPVAALLLGERATPPVVAGAGLVIAAVYVGALRRGRPRPRVSVPESPERVPDPASGS